MLGPSAAGRIAARLFCLAHACDTSQVQLYCGSVLKAAPWQPACIPATLDCIENTAS